MTVKIFVSTKIFISYSYNFLQRNKRVEGEKQTIHIRFFTGVIKWDLIENLPSSDH